MACVEARRRAIHVRRDQFTEMLSSGFWRDGHRTEIVPSWLRTRMSNSRSLRSRRATALHLTPDAAALGDQRPSMAAEAAGLPRAVGPGGIC